MAGLKAIPSKQSRVSASASEAAADFAKAAEASDVTGFCLIWLDRDGEIKTRSAFLRRLELIGAAEAAKMALWEVRD